MIIRLSKAKMQINWRLKWKINDLKTFLRKLNQTWKLVNNLLGISIVSLESKTQRECSSLDIKQPIWLIMIQSKWILQKSKISYINSNKTKRSCKASHNLHHHPRNLSQMNKTKKKLTFASVICAIEWIS